MNHFFTKTRLLATTFAFVFLFAAALLGQGQAEAAPKAVTLTSFRTTCARSMIIVSWTTDMERFTEGYNLYRSTSKSVLGERLNTSMIPQNGGNGAGSYVHNDTNVAPATNYFYTVEEIARNGNTVQHGPVAGNLSCARINPTR
jgi:hypothetical protein